MQRRYDSTGVGTQSKGGRAIARRYPNWSDKSYPDSVCGDKEVLPCPSVAGAYLQ